MFKQGVEDGTINNFEHNVFRKVMVFGNNEARSIMTPRIKVTHIREDDEPESIITKILEAPHRYYPVINNSPESILGIIDTKELLNKKLSQEPINISSMIQKAPIVPEDSTGPQVLQSFRDQPIQIALVVDEHGAFKGIITPHDVLESLIGALAGVQEHNDKNVLLQNDGSWLCGGLTSIHTLEEILHISMEDPLKRDDFNTLAGFMLRHLNHIPMPEEKFAYKGFEFAVIEMEHQKIALVLITPLLTLDVIA
jgi:putative hemolysin